MAIELAMWANLQAEYTGWIMIISGLLGVTINFSGGGIGYYAVLMGIFICIFEYPRSKRKKGTNVPRMYQEYITPILYTLGFAARNYYIRFLVYTGASLPLFFLLPTMLSGMLLLSASSTYLFAALRQEQWTPIQLAWGKGASQQQQQVKHVATSEPPSQPPPRAPTTQTSSSGLIEKNN